MSLFAELQRRNVVRVGIAYSIIAWAMAQIAEFAFETFGAPEWVLKSVVVVLLLGLPIALFFAWAFEITPEGLKREKDVDRSQSITPQTGRKLDRAIVVGLVVVGVLIVARPWLPGAAESPIVSPIGDQAENSIAVLPFADLSQEGDQEYFADGISEEILNVLVRIPGLKVAGRTSSFSFKGKSEDIRAIGEALGVNHVLEGSVRRSGDKLRITAQLIRGADGFHLWSETYDRDMAEIFTIQDEIARSVADQLAVSLGLTGGSLVTDRTENIAAYDNFLRARQLNVARGKENLELALLLLQESVALDPTFAPVWSEVAGVYSNYHAYQDRETVARSALQWRAIGIAAAERAIELNPDDGAAHAYQGAILALENDWIHSFEAYDRAIELAPDDGAVFDSFAQNLLEAGYVREALEHSARAVSLDPLAAIFRNSYALALSLAGETDHAIEEFENAMLIDPDLVFPYGNLAITLIRQHKFDDSAAVIEKGVAKGFFTQNGLEFNKTFVEALGDEDALRGLLGKYGSGPDRALAFLLNDQELMISLHMQRWSRENPVNRYVFTPASTSFYDDPRWKEQVRRYGMSDLWRARGFPSQCRAAGADDFECVPFSVQ